MEQISPFVLALTLVPSIVSGGIVALMLRWRPDRDSAIATGSKSAVEAMRIALDSANGALDEAEATITTLRAEIGVLQVRLSQLEAQQKIAA